MAVAKPAPAWLVPGADVYAVDGRAMDGYNVRRLTVERLTATQVIVTNGVQTWRYRLDTLRQVGVEHYSSPELAAPDDHRVIETQQRDKVRDAMSGLWNVFYEAGQSARIYKTELALAREMAKRFRDAAQHALDSLPEV